MFGKRLCIAVLTVVTMLTASAVAQDKNEMAALIGRTFISDQGITNATYPSDHSLTAKG